MFDTDTSQAISGDVTHETLTFDVSIDGFDRKEALAALDKFGAIILRGVFPEDDIAALADGAQNYLEKPSIAGSFGYYRKDYGKKLVDPFMIGGHSVDVCLNEWLIDFIEAYMDSECVLSEAFIKEDVPTEYVYFPIHADYAPGTIRRSESDFVITAEALADPVGVGAALYLADSVEGAFCFCLGTHKLKAPKGQEIDLYDPEEKQRILSTRCRMEGQKGDIVVFDDRGFHGPDQPSPSVRLVMLLDWTRSQSWDGPAQAAPLRVFTSDLSRLSPKQLRVVGIGARTLGPRDTYHMHTFGQRKSGRLAFKLAHRLIEDAFLVNHWKRTIRARLGRVLSRPRS